MYALAMKLLYQQSNTDLMLTHDSYFR